MLLPSVSMNQFPLVIKSTIKLELHAKAKLGTSQTYIPLVTKSNKGQHVIRLSFDQETIVSGKLGMVAFGLDKYEFLSFLVDMENSQETSLNPQYRQKAGAALGRVPWVPVNPWISRIFAEEPMKFDIKSDPSRIVNPWIEISNVAPAVSTHGRTNEWKDGQT